MSAPSGPVWPSLRAAAAALCPPFEVAAEHPGKLALDLQDPRGGADLRVRYRSERGLFLRTYFLVIESEIEGAGPSGAGRLVLGRRGLAWKRPKPRDFVRWRNAFASDELRRALRRVPIERLTLDWTPDRSSWNVVLETLSGGVTVTFFPPLMTPNPLLREEADALVAAFGALRTSTRTPA